MSKPYRPTGSGAVCCQKRARFCVGMIQEQDVRCSHAPMVARCGKSRSSAIFLLGLSWYVGVPQSVRRPCAGESAAIPSNPPAPRPTAGLVPIEERRVSHQRFKGFCPRTFLALMPAGGGGAGRYGVIKALSRHDYATAPPCSFLEGAYSYFRCARCPTPGQLLRNGKRWSSIIVFM